jgi:hypothetical protein
MGDPREDSRVEEEAEKEELDLREEWASLAADWLSHLFPKSAKLPSDDETPDHARPASRNRWLRH